MGKIMRGGIAFQPILLDEGQNRRLTELGLPHHAQQRGERFLAIAIQRPATTIDFGALAVAAFRTGTETKIDQPTARRRRHLIMRHLVNND